MRKAIVAGSFYPADKNLLEKQIKSFLSSIKTESGKSRVVISPHAGYVFSGQTAVKSISCLEKAETFIILGANHNYSGNADIIFSLEDFETPLGIIENNAELSEKLADLAIKSKIKSEFNENLHMREHSIEVQLPFLQVLFSRDKFRFIPIIINTKKIDVLKKFAEILFQFMKKSKISVIASSDFTHYGYNYGFVPFTNNIKENLEKLDMMAIKPILDLNTESFVEKSEKTTICGSAPISLAMEIAKKLKCKKGKLIDYKTSAEISGDYNNAVSYAGIRFI
jgi:hypothetical protein